MKSTLCQSDPVELVNYKWAHPQFPHDPTSDLVFNRDQFESYRHLGQYTAEAALSSILKFARPSSANESSRRIDSPRDFIEFVRDASEWRVHKSVTSSKTNNTTSATNEGIDSDPKARDTEKDKTQSEPHSKKASEETKAHAKTQGKARVKTQTKENANPSEPLDGAQYEAAAPTTATLPSASAAADTLSSDSSPDLPIEPKKKPKPK